MIQRTGGRCEGVKGRENEVLGITLSVGDGAVE
jgi:hypothetical protein